ncbi:MAG: NF038143 family protein [Candidatus Odinarchaeota archaeon]
METLANKKKWILDQERGFAQDLARRVIDIPRLSMWMILIPIILVYHVYRHNNALKGRSAFVEHYLLSRTRSLEEAYHALTEQRSPDIDGVVARAVDLPPSARSAYKSWIAVLTRHYGDLLQASGTDFKELVQSAYHNRSNYLILLNQLNQLEKSLNAALNTHLAESTANVAETIQRIEAATTELRRHQAEACFS